MPIQYYYDRRFRTWLTGSDYIRRNNITRNRLNRGSRQGSIINSRNPLADNLTVSFPGRHFNGVSLTTRTLRARYGNNVLSNLQDRNTVKRISRDNDRPRAYTYRVNDANMYQTTYICENNHPPFLWRNYALSVNTTLDQMCDDGVFPWYLEVNDYLTLAVPYILENVVRFKNSTWEGPTTLTQIKKEIMRKMASYEYATNRADDVDYDALDEGALVDSRYFFLSVAKQNIGGRINNFDALNATQFTWCHALDITSRPRGSLLPQDNNCFFRCIKVGLSLRERNIDRLRASLGILHNNGIGLAEAEQLANLLHMVLTIYDKNQEILLQTTQGDSEVELILDNGHYYYIQAFISLTEKNRREQEKRRNNLGLNVYKGARGPHVLSLKEFKSKQPNFIRRCYDFETVFDPDDSRFAKTYMVSWIDSVKKCFKVSRPWEDGKEVWKYGEWEHEEEAHYIFDPVNFSCARQFAELLLKDCETNFIQVCDFNGARFDQFLLLAEISKLYDPRSEFKGISNLIYNNNSIFMFEACKRRIFSLDVAKIISSTSLDEACKDFEVKDRKITLDLFSHADIQHYYESGTLLTWLQTESSVEHKTFHDLLVEYGKRDSVCLQQLVNKVEAALIEIMGTDGELGYGMQTIGMKAKKYWLSTIDKETLTQIPHKDKYTKNKENDTSSLSYPNKDQYDLMRQTMIAGRTECMQKKSSKYMGIIKMIDIVSLYPGVMLFGKFPVGPSRTLSFQEVMNLYSEQGWDKICEKPGFFRVRVLNQHTLIQEKKLRHAIIPRSKVDKNNGRRLDWSPKGSFCRALNTIDIKNGLKYGLQFVPVEKTEYDKDDSGIACNAVIFPEYSDKVFANFIPVLQNLKKTQDIYKDTGDKRYNPGLREIYKRFMNSMSGKIIQKAYREVGKLIFNLKDRDNFLNKHQLKSLKVINKNLALITGIKKEELNELNEDISEYKSNPEIGSILYSQARGMMNPAYQLCLKALYTDTDSIAVPESDYKTLLLEMPEHFGEEFGQFKLEKYGCDMNEGFKINDQGEWEYFRYHEDKKLVKDMEINYAIFLSPKMYCFMNDSWEDGINVRRILKVRFKGIQLKDTYACGFAPKSSTSREIEGVFTDLIGKDESFVLQKMLERAVFPVVSPGFFERLFYGLPTTVLSSQFVRHFDPDPITKPGYSVFGIRNRLLFKRIAITKTDVGSSEDIYE